MAITVELLNLDPAETPPGSTAFALTLGRKEGEKLLRLAEGADPLDTLRVLIGQALGAAETRSWHRARPGAGRCSILDCGAPATWVLHQRDATMPAPGFYGYCDAHADASRAGEPLGRR